MNTDRCPVCAIEEAAKDVNQAARIGVFVGLRLSVLSRPPEFCTYHATAWEDFQSSFLSTAIVAARGGPC